MLPPALLPASKAACQDHNKANSSMTESFPRKWGAIFRNPSCGLFGLLTIALVLLAPGGDSGRQLLRYEREAVLAGEYWRLLTAHFVHGGTWHLLLNTAGLACTGVLFARDLTVGSWLLVVLLSIAAIDLGFVFCEPQLQWYLGYSGVLHGMLAAGACMCWKHGSGALGMAFGAVLAGKLVWEQWQGALPLAGELPVVVDAHLYGALGGVFAVLVLLLCSWFRQGKVPPDWPRGPSSL